MSVAELNEIKLNINVSESPPPPSSSYDVYRFLTHNPFNLHYGMSLLNFTQNTFENKLDVGNIQFK